MEPLNLRVEGGLKRYVEGVADGDRPTDISDAAAALIRIGIRTEQKGRIHLQGPSGYVPKPFADMDLGGDSTNLSTRLPEDEVEELRSVFGDKKHTSARQALRLGVFVVYADAFELKIRGYGSVNPFEEARLVEDFEDDIQDLVERLRRREIGIESEEADTSPKRWYREEVAGILGTMRESPTIEEVEAWSVAPHAELHATNDAERDDGTRIMHHDGPPEDGYVPVYKGASFGLWHPDTGEYYAWADPDTVAEYLQEKRERSYKYAGSRSAFSDMDEDRVRDPDTLAFRGPRIAYRKHVPSTGDRAMVPCLVPPETPLTNNAPYLLWTEGGVEDEAYLLGVLSSIPLDWYVRRTVGGSISVRDLTSLHVPEPDGGLADEIADVAGRLAAVDDRYRGWADRLGVGCGPVGDDEKRESVYRLDALVAHAYGLGRGELENVLESCTEHRTSEDVLDYHDAYSGKDERKTEVLDIYDRIADGAGDNAQRYNDNT